MQPPARPLPHPQPGDASQLVTGSPPANDVDPGPIATILETRDRLWPGQPLRWVCTVRAGRAGAGRPVLTVGRRHRAAALLEAWQWCVAHGYLVVEVRPGAQRRGVRWRSARARRAK